MSASQHVTSQHVTMADRFRVRRSRGAVSGLALVLLGLWGAVIPFIGPVFGYAYSPATAWTYTSGRLWLEVLPGAATLVAGLILLGGANRVSGMFAGWLAAASGAWFVVGPILSTLWTVNLPAAGVPVGDTAMHRAVEQIGFFAGLGVVITFFGALALGRMTVLGVRDVARPTTAPTDTRRGEPTGTRRTEPTETHRAEPTDTRRVEHRADPVEAERTK
jgi:hypothetical protein